jgi:hypothetical protein
MGCDVLSSIPLGASRDLHFIASLATACRLLGPHVIVACLTCPLEMSYQSDAKVTCSVEIHFPSRTSCDCSGEDGDQLGTVT